MNDIQLANKYLNKARNANDRGIQFNLSLVSYRNLMRAKKCYYTGLDLVDIDGAPNQRSIDRINADLPYEKGNVVACCAHFNKLKGQMERDRDMIQSPIFQKAIAKMFREVNKRK